jgi:hypothetical protein
MISILIFGFISVIVVNIFASILSSQQRILRSQELMNQSSYTLEYMTKMIRMAQRDDVGDCVGIAGQNYGVGTNSITFLTYDISSSSYKCIQFLKEGNTIKEMISTDEDVTNLQTAQAITSSAVKVDDVTFNVTGDSVVGDSFQPKITVMIKMESVSSFSNPPTITIQTSISQRELDI